MNENEKDVIVAHCGLVCSECGAFKKSKCKGCHGGKPMFRNCPIKKCNLDHQRTTCADCTEVQELADCGKLNNLISKFFAMVFHTNRIENLNTIRKVGLEQFKTSQD